MFTSTFLPILLALLPLTNAACYAPNGDLQTNIAYQPCILVTGIHSTCCALNRTIVGGVADKCAQNGLCIAADGTSWRGFCTDKDWNSPGCLGKNVCGDTEGGTSSNSNQLTKCEDGTYCCGGNTSCCSSKNGGGFSLNPTLISIKTATVNSAYTSTTSSPSQECTTSPDALKALAVSKGANATVVGVGVGVPLAVLAVVGSLVGFWLGKRRGREDHGKLLVGGGIGGKEEGIGEYKPYGEVVGGFGEERVGQRYEGFRNAGMEGERPLELRGADVLVGELDQGRGR